MIAVDLLLFATQNKNMLSTLPLLKKGIYSDPCIPCFFGRYLLYLKTMLNFV
jgi:hypothetical protein